MTKYCDAQRGKMAYTDTGRGDPAVLLVHGLPTSKELWSPVLPLLDGRYRVVAVDLHDYGESARLSAPTTHRERAAALDELRAHLGLSRLCLVAHDLGASVAIDYMGAFADRVDKLVLMSPPVYPEFREPPIVKLIRVRGAGELLLRLAKDALMRSSIRRGMVHKDRYTPALHGAIAGAFDGPEGRAALMRNLRWGTPPVMFAAYPEIIRGIQVPTLILQGMQDPYIPRGHVHRLEKDLRDARLVLLDDGGHFLPMDTPGRVAEELNRFIG